MMWSYNMTGMGWWMIISSLIWFGLIAVAVWAFARWAARPSQLTIPSTPATPSATEILRQRFARGEIDSDTFERMRRELDASSIEPRTPTTVSEVDQLAERDGCSRLSLLMLYAVSGRRKRTKEDSNDYDDGRHSVPRQRS